MDKKVLKFNKYFVKDRVKENLLSMQMRKLIEEITRIEGRKMTQKEISEKLKISVGFLNMLLSGKRNITIKKLEEIAINVGKPLYWFFKENKENRKDEVNNEFINKIFKIFAKLSYEEKLKYLEILKYMVIIDNKYKKGNNSRVSLKKIGKYNQLIDFSVIKNLKNE
jgi:transcriptional regulator with XRE-family HTH domain